jgi:3-hydroxybutyryl-CoA dehydrogenase
LKKSKINSPHIKLLISQGLASGRSQGGIAHILGTSQPTISRIARQDDVRELIRKEEKKLFRHTEAALEKIELKSELFKRLDKICSKDSILASNTSSIPITQLAALVTNPNRVVGMHFFNPVPVMKLVEIVRAIQTSEKTIQTIRAVSIRLGKTAVLVADSAGFISNRILCPMINEAVFALEEGIATKEDIDTVMKIGMNHPMGPLELADFVGLDVLLDVLDVLYREFQDPKYRASPLLRRMVRAGYLGRKTKKGFYDYP